MADVTLTITPSNQEDFLNALAQKIVDRGMDQEILVRLVDDVVDHVNFEDMSEQVLDNIDYDELRNEIVREMDYDDLVSEVVDRIDKYELARDVLDNLDVNDIIYHTGLDDKIDDQARTAIAEHTENFEQQINDLQVEISNLKKMNDALIEDIVAITSKQQKSLFRRIFG